MECNTRIEVNFTLNQWIMMHYDLTTIPHAKNLINELREKKVKVHLETQYSGHNKISRTCSMSTLF